MQCHPGDINIIDQDPPGIDIVKTGEKIDNRALARPGRSHKRHALTWVYREGNMVKHMLSLLVTKANILKCHLALYLF